MATAGQDSSYIQTGVVLGRGSFGTVYKGYDSRNGQAVAIKKPNKKQGKIEFNKELNILKELPPHKNIIKVLDCKFFHYHDLSLCIYLNTI